MTTRLIPPPVLLVSCALTAAQSQGLADVPPALAWYAHLTHARTRAASKQDLADVHGCVGRRWWDARVVGCHGVRQAQLLPETHGTIRTYKDDAPRTHLSDGPTLSTPRPGHPPRGTHARAPPPQRHPMAGKSRGGPAGMGQVALGVSRGWEAGRTAPNGRRTRCLITCTWPCKRITRSRC